MESNYASSFKIEKEGTLTVEELKSSFFFGIPIVSPDGTLMSDDDIQFYIDSAIAELETELDIKIPLQIISENKDFNRENYTNWGHIRTTYPIVCVHSVGGFVGKVRQVDYPKEWFSIQKSNDNIRHRHFSIVPNSSQNGLIDQSIIYAGTYAQMGYHGNRIIPNYWHIDYTTGFSEMPSDLKKFVGMKASIPLYDQLGDLILGAGIASQSLGIDGLSQSISSTSSATNAGYGARITSYNKQVKEMLPNLKKKYRGVIFGSA